MKITEASAPSSSSSLGCAEPCDPEPSFVRASEAREDVRASDGAPQEEREASGVCVRGALLGEPRRTSPSARIRFYRGVPQCVLTVDAPASEDWMPELYRLLHDAHVQVVRVHAQVMGDTVRHELEVIEYDGTPLPDDRWRAVQSTAISYLGDRIMMLGSEASSRSGTYELLRKAD